MNIISLFILTNSSKLYLPDINLFMCFLFLTRQRGRDQTRVEGVENGFGGVISLKHEPSLDQQGIGTHDRPMCEGEE